MKISSIPDVRLCTAIILLLHLIQLVIHEQIVLVPSQPPAILVTICMYTDITQREGGEKEISLMHKAKDVQARKKRIKSLSKLMRSHAHINISYPWCVYALPSYSVRESILGVACSMMMDQNGLADISIIYLSSFFFLGKKGGCSLWKMKNNRI